MLSAESRSRLLRLPSVRDPFRGVVQKNLAIPDNVLLFHRRTFKSLTGHHGRDYHHRFVLIVNLETSGQVGIDERVLTFHPGEAILIFPHQFHFYPRADAANLSWLFLTFEIAQDKVLEPLRGHKQRLSHDAYPVIEALLSRVTSKGFEFSGVDNCLILESARLLDIVRGAAATRDRILSKRLGGDLLESVARHAFSRKTGTFPTIQQLAKWVGLSESRLRTRFRAAAGISLGVYLRRVRIARACGLLTSTELRVTEIAEQCQFESLYSFSRCFRAETGRSPLAYRRAMA